MLISTNDKAVSQVTTQDPVNNTGNIRIQVSDSELFTLSCSSTSKKMIITGLLLFSHSITSNSFATPWAVAHSVHGISHRRTLEWIVISFSRGSFPPRDQTHVSSISRKILYHRATRKALSLDIQDKMQLVCYITNNIIHRLEYIHFTQLIRKEYSGQTIVWWVRRSRICWR